MPDHARPLFLVLLSIVIAGCGGDQPVAVGQTARDRVELTSEAPEPIVEILVAEGSQVSAGDILLRQQPERVAAQLAQAQGARDRSAARLAELKRGPRRERIESTRARLQGAQSRLQNAAAQLARTAELVDRNLATAAERDRAVAERDSALAEVNSLRADLEALLEGTTIEELRQAESALDESEARVRELRVVIDRLSVTAPRSGILDALPFQEGERPPAGATVAVMLAGRPYARVYIPEPYRARLTAGTIVPIRVDGFPEPFPGRVRFVSGDAAFTPFYALTEHDRSRLSFLAEIDFIDVDDHNFATGVPVQVNLSGIDNE